MLAAVLYSFKILNNIFHFFGFEYIFKSRQYALNSSKVRAWGRFLKELGRFLKLGMEIQMPYILRLVDQKRK